MRLFARQRTTDGVGVTIPSQRRQVFVLNIAIFSCRYIFYFYRLLTSGKTLPPPVQLQLQQIRLCGLPKHVLPKLMVCLWLRENNSNQNILIAEVRSVSATKHNGTLSPIGSHFILPSAKSVQCTSPSGTSYVCHLPNGEKYHLLINSKELFIIFEHDAGPANMWKMRGGDLKIQVHFSFKRNHNTTFRCLKRRCPSEVPYFLLG